MKTRKAQNQLSLVPLVALITPSKIENPIDALSHPSEQASFQYDVSPALARLWLADKTLNRKVGLNDKRIAGYADLMKADNWYLGEALLFNPEGRLCDGQHRLMALVACGLTVKFWITTGITAEAMAFLNSGKPRSQHQAMTIAGCDVSPLEVALIKVLLNPLGRPWNSGNHRSLSMDRQLITDLFEEHKEALRFVSKCYGKQKLLMCKYAPIRSVAVRGYYHLDKEDLARFLGILDGNSAKSDSDEMPQMLMRMYTLSGKYSKDAASMHAKATHALKAFSQDKSLKFLIAITEQPFPLPSFDCLAEAQTEETLARLAEQK